MNENCTTIQKLGTNNKIFQNALTRISYHIATVVVLCIPPPKEKKKPLYRTREWSSEKKKRKEIKRKCRKSNRSLHNRSRQRIIVQQHPATCKLPYLETRQFRSIISK